MFRNRLSQSFVVVALSLCSFAFTEAAEAQVAGPATRLRIGVEGGAGGEWGTPRGASLGLYGQLGLQLGNTFAIFYQPSLSVHALSSDEDNPDVFAAWGNLAMADLTFGFLQLGVGGGIDVGRFASCDDNGCDDRTREVYPALGGRVAGVISIPTLRGRLGIPIALNIHSTFLNDDDRVTSLVLTVGVQRF
jgi:hypothetical protein